MRILALMLTLVLALVLALPALAADINEEINRVYGHISQAYNDLDTERLVQFYSSGACVISASKEEGLLSGRDQIAKGFGHWFKKIKKRGAELKVHYRVVNRLVSDGTVTDAGYYLVVYTPDRSTEQPASEFVGKFIMSFQRDDTNQWRIISDSANRTKVNRFLDAERKQGLFYEEYRPADPQDKESRSR
ncbi:hypothetical protein FCL40_03400 [Ferrimonas sediminicola]|uniref:SnoaL-like domain-containing protein n=1 Tax=Ferrimonas sediminicola TaxID=2569538 RepID=A0A4U1BJD4_9GAMM|nr:hypothetical protein [Ferrimonas sediminicola]TKB50220.1 hypothetical protein FCL40_03400 [Ferrimonas sediminicola]